MRPRNGSFPYHTQVLERTFAILSSLATSREDQGFVEIAEQSALPRSTCYRLLRILELHHFADRDIETGKYRLGSRLLELGKQAAEGFDLVQLARPYLRRLSRDSGETAHLGVLSAGEVISIASVDGRHALRISGMLGRRDPIHCSSLGKAILAFLPAREADQLVRECDLKAYTRNTITSRTEFQRELQEIRERGYALDDQELEAGLGCIGAPVHDSSGRVAAAVSIAGAAFRLSPERLPALAHLVVQTAFDLSGRLGYRG